MRNIVSSLLVVACLTSCGHGRAEPSAPASVIDPPDRVARISFIRGPVSFKAAGEDAWVAAELNRPLTVGDELWTDADARAELDLGHAFLRLDSQSSLTFLNLNDHDIQISLSAGTAQVRLRRLDEEDEFEVSTPQAAFTLLRTGDYRFRVDNGTVTSAIVRSGQMEAASTSQAVTIRAQQGAKFTDGTPNYEITPTPPLDGFDDFCGTRDQRAANGETEQYVSPYVIGREDLSENGSWQVNGSYGPVWFPRVVAPGWAPYRFGHWVWIEPWGWTWVDDAPWGFAPFHYGRWMYLDRRWGWIPGPPRIRAVYAPALVVFAGGGPGYRFYFSIGGALGVAWFPLGPREIYIPPYRSSRVYVTNINVSHTVIVNRGEIWKTDMARQRYVNRNIAGAMTAVHEDVFARGRPVASAAVNVNVNQARTAQIGGSAPPVIPYRGVREGPSAPRPPDGFTQRPPTVRQTPAARPAETDRRQLERDPGRPIDSSRPQRTAPETQPGYRQVRPPAPAPRPQAAPPAVPASPRQTEQRRQGIERERQRAQPPPSRRNRN